LATPVVHRPPSRAAAGPSPNAGDRGRTRHRRRPPTRWPPRPGRDILRQGGSAVDAAIAIQMVLTLVEPHPRHRGGGFPVNYDFGRR
jgi:gamma-glutamyltranspeptidase/glutathione hydrolase